MINKKCEGGENQTSNNKKKIGNQKACVVSPRLSK